MKNPEVLQMKRAIESICTDRVEVDQYFVGIRLHTENQSRMDLRLRKNATTAQLLLCPYFLHIIKAICVSFCVALRVHKTRKLTRRWSPSCFHSCSWNRTKKNRPDHKTINDGPHPISLFAPHRYQETHQHYKTPTPISIRLDRFISIPL
jgi:hypothetical protein